MYASPVTRMTSQLSQPSSSISARDVGRNGATPNRCAQYGRCANRPARALGRPRTAFRSPLLPAGSFMGQRLARPAVGGSLFAALARVGAERAALGRALRLLR